MVPVKPAPWLLCSVSSVLRVQSKKGFSVPVWGIRNPSEISSHRPGPSPHPSEETAFHCFSVKSDQDPGAEMSSFWLMHHHWHLPLSALTAVQENLLSALISRLKCGYRNWTLGWDSADQTYAFRESSLFLPKICVSTGHMNQAKWARRPGRFSSEGDILFVDI